MIPSAFCLAHLQVRVRNRPEPHVPGNCLSRQKPHAQTAQKVAMSEILTPMRIPLTQLVINCEGTVSMPRSSVSHALLTQSVIHKILQAELASATQGWAPLRVLMQIRVIVAEH